MKALDAIIHQWQAVSKMYPTAQVRRQISVTQSPPSLDMGTGKWLHVSECELEHRFFEDFSVLLPPWEVLQNTEPELAKLVSEYRNGCSLGLRQEIERYLNTYWSVNPTVIDLEWEANKELKGPPDFGGFDPFHIIEAVRKATNIQEMNAKCPDAINFVTSFFSPTHQLLHSFQDELIVEVIVGDMMDVLERIRYDRFPRPGPASPKEYHVIHMSNIPYVHLFSNAFQ